jgi:hypothetical protein
VFRHCFWLKENKSQLFDAASTGIAPYTSSPVRSGQLIMLDYSIIVLSSLPYHLGCMIELVKKGLLA